MTVSAKAQQVIKSEYAELFQQHFSGITSEGVSSMEDFLAGLKFRMQEIFTESLNFDSSNTDETTLPHNLQALAALLNSKAEEIQKMADIAALAVRAGGINIQQKKEADGTSNTSENSS